MSPGRLATAYVRFAVTCAVASFPAGACAGETGVRTDAGSPAFVLHDRSESDEFGAVDVNSIDQATLEVLRELEPQDPHWSDVLTVWTSGADQSVIGRYHTIDNGIRFTPRFPPVSGLVYEIRYSPRDGGPSIDTVMLVKRDDDVDAAVRVTAIHPGGDIVPMNLLRAYIRFSGPMSEGEAYNRIRLLDASGEPVPDAFLILERELWDPDRTRFTLMFDPGRIKRGLVPNEDLGLPLREGRQYTLVVDAGWTDARGRPLAEGFNWSFLAGPADRASPRPGDWSLQSPAAGSREPAVIDIGEPLDQALLERLITVLDSDGSSVVGTAAVSLAGARWAFTPAEPWTAGEYSIEIGTELEDLAGNNLRHLFDVDRSDRQDTGVTSQLIHLPLTVR